MRNDLPILALAVLGGIGAMVVPSVGQAANVGYLPTCAWAGGQGDPTSIIAAAGHTPVPVASATPASLAGLQALMVSNCNYSSMSSTINPAIISAVSGGMKLIISDWNPSSDTASALPGAPAIVMTFAPGVEIDIPSGSPVASGPGGTLNDSSLDGGTSSNHGYTSSALPAGAVAMLTTGDHSQKVGFQYTYGSGTVAYSAIPLDYYFPGGTGASNANYPTGARTYVINLLAFAVSTTTCASEGYKGAQLTWCKNICENGLTGPVLDTWIHRWIDRYRDLPYCARETTPPPPPPPPQER